MNTQDQPVPAGTNRKIYEAIFEQAEGIIWQLPDYEELIAQNALFFEKFGDSLGQEERRLLEDLVARTCTLVATEAFYMGFTVGMSPAAALALPDSPYTG
jgi:hypothetical protein